MDYVILCSDTAKCRPILQQFLKENNIENNKVTWNMIPYRVELTQDDCAWVVPQCLFERWSRGREIEVVCQV